MSQTSDGRSAASGFAIAGIAWSMSAGVTGLMIDNAVVRLASIAWLALGTYLLIGRVRSLRRTPPNELSHARDEASPPLP